jgi:hypothetical protein
MARSPTGDLGEGVPTSFPETTPRGTRSLATISRCKP